jgi:hypothetical protein
MLAPQAHRIAAADAQTVELAGTGRGEHHARAAAGGRTVLLVHELAHRDAALHALGERQTAALLGVALARRLAFAPPQLRQTRELRLGIHQRGRKSGQTRTGWRGYFSGRSGHMMNTLVLVRT